MKEVVDAVNQEKALVGAFSVIVQPVVEPMDRFTALEETVKLLCAGLGWAGRCGNIFQQVTASRPATTAFTAFIHLVHPAP